MRTSRRVRATGLGLATAFLVVAFVVAAYAFGYPDLAVLGVGAFVVLCASAAAVLPRPRAELERTVFPGRVARGEPAVGMLTVRNRSAWTGLRLAVREQCGGEIPVAVPYLRRLTSCEVGYQLPTGRRGRLTVGPLIWERVDRFGLMRRQYALAGTQPLIVHPVAHPFDLASALRSVPHDSARSDAAPEGTITFHKLREYVPGDDLRKIHWRSSARTGTLMVRQNIDVSRPRLTALLVTDRSAYPDPALFEEAVDAVASALVAALRIGVPARLWTSDGAMLGGRGGHDEARVFLDRLADVELTDGTGLSAATDRLRHASAGGTLVVVGGAGSGAGRGRSAASGRGDPEGDEEELRAVRILAARYAPAAFVRFGASAFPTTGQSASAGFGPGANRALTLVDAASAQEFCARWNSLVRT